jgi:Holliday junction resolvase-like predicted endonuclease
MDLKYREPARIGAAPARLDDAAARVVVDEKQKLAWNRWHYANTFSEVRDAAAYGVPAQGYRAERPEPKSQKKLAQAKRDADKLAALPLADPARRDQWILPPLPSVADARDQDLRDTAVTWLARAGCTMMEIAQITGHSLQSIQQTLRHYLSSHPEIADHAIAKLVAWYEGQMG